jgi:hypothetical protein
MCQRLHVLVKQQLQKHQQGQEVELKQQWHHLRGVQVQLQHHQAVQWVQVVTAQVVQQ